MYPHRYVIKGINTTCYPVVQFISISIACSNRRCYYHSRIIGSTVIGYSSRVSVAYYIYRHCNCLFTSCSRLCNQYVIKSYIITCSAIWTTIHSYYKYQFWIASSYIGCNIYWVPFIRIWRISCWNIIWVRNKQSISMIFCICFISINIKTDFYRITCRITSMHRIK